MYIHTYILCILYACTYQGHSYQSGLSGHGWTTFSQDKNKISFYRKQVINKGAMVIFGLARLVILAQQIEKLYQEFEKY